MRDTLRRFVTQHKTSLLVASGIIILASIFLHVTNTASAAVTYIANTTDTASGSTITLPLPAGAVQGDVVMIAASMRRDTATVNCPQGDTPTANSAYFEATNLTSVRSQPSDSYTETFYKVVGASDTSYTISIKGQCLKSACMCYGYTTATAKYTATAVAYHGVDSLAVVDASISGGSTGTTITAPTMTTTAANDMVFGVFSVVGSSTISSTDVTQRVQLVSTGGSGASKGTIMAGDYTQATAGATGAKTATSSVSGANVGMQVALKAKIYPSFTQAAYRWFNNLDAVGTVSFLESDNAGTPTYGYNGITQASDGDYVTTGSGGVLAKYSSSGVLRWSKGGAGEGYAVTETSDGGFAVVGQTSTYGGGSWDIFVSKYTAAGDMSWTRTWGDTGAEYGKSIVETSDGGVAVSGYGDDGTTHNGFLLKYTSTGTLSWQRSFGEASGMDRAYGLTETSDAGLVITGFTSSYGVGGYDLYIAKYTSTGALSWSQIIGGASDDVGQAVIESGDGGLLVTGNTASYGAGSTDALVAKFTSTGTLSWAKTWGGTGIDHGYSITEAADGRVAIAGDTASYGAGGYDSFLAEYTAAGVLSWSKTYGSATNEYGYAVAKTADTGYVVGGADTGGFIAKYTNTGTITNCSTTSGGGKNPPPPPCSSPNASSSAVSPSTSAPSFTSTTQNRATSSPVITPATWGSVTRTEIAAPTSQTVDVGTALAGANTSAIAPAQGTPFRLRFVMHVGTIAVNPSDESFKLQVAARGTDGVCDTGFSTETYADVSKTSGAIRFYHNQNSSDGIAFTANANDPADSNHTKVLQTYEENNPFPVTSAIQVGQDGMWDVALVNNSATAGASYCFRVIKNDNSLLDTYSVVPEVSIPSTATVEQSSYRLYQNADGVVPGAPLAAQNTAASVVAGTPFRLRQLVTQTTGSSSIGATAYKLQLGQKVSTCSAASYADATLFQNNPTPVDDATITSSVNDPTPAAGTTVLQSYNENLSFNTVAAIATGNSGLWDFSLTSDQTYAGKTYCFRIVDGTGAAITTYTNYPEISFTSSSPTLDQQLRGGQAVVNGVKSPLSW